MGVNSTFIESSRGLKILDVLIQYAILSKESGLDIISHSEEIGRRFLEKHAELELGRHLETPIDILFVLYDLRINAAHRQTNIDAHLRRLGTNYASVEAGWGRVLDKLYDDIGMALEKTTEILHDAETMSHIA